MNIDIIKDRIGEYRPTSKQEEINALKEIYQEIALSGLARSDFFKIGAFQGGTCLRILYKLKRFSEDLDFILMQPQVHFKWHSYLLAIELEFKSFGLSVKIKDRSEAAGAVKKAFLKQDSFGQIIELKHPLLPSDRQTVEIKLEIDTNPPLGSQFESHFLEYPFPFSIIAQDIPSLFAGKCHALLCRDFVKGRDWFDFLWYISKNASINLEHLQNALLQAGPHKNVPFPLSQEWLKEELRKKIISIDWDKARGDVESFLTLQDKKTVSFWSRDLFLEMLKKLQTTAP